MRPGVGPALRQPLAEITHGRSYGAAIWIISGRALACQHTQRHSGFICLPQRFGSQRLAPYLRRIVIPSSPLFSRWIEHALDVAVQCPHDADPRKHRRAAELDHQHHWANFMVETGHLPSWPLMEIRRPWSSSSQMFSTVPAFPSVRTTALPTSSVCACSNLARITDA
jgi:hypothetical protein